MTGTLYIVATPIGNLEDITLRALKTLKEVDLILAEDTRTTSILLKAHNIKNNLVSYNQHSYKDIKKLSFILEQIRLGKNIALVTDAGTPAISDPGNELVDFLLQSEPTLKVVPIPGPSSLTAAISVSGLDMSKFLFLGFWPKKKKTKLVKNLKELNYPFVFFESPFRVVKTLEDVKKEFGQDTTVFVARELTKLHETRYYGKVDAVLTQLTTTPLKGEVVVVVELGK
ncbi:MAG TPA: 16S rRNA (cytidine(1402)-2'-O)-methyltransferase [Patescibacteria group bacterium]